eukprot:TRINITY_DN55775_c0_g1_i2.p1 TRINITY_DN55775_c0_g1~~TRINITY_DN55775_c0_g1_i2.p1  ORF type:complete len:559 (+),score=120.80 TRINITY_DN55775_c0_g1_i2:206-1882(+)
MCIRDSINAEYGDRRLLGMAATSPEPSMVALDWGTSSLRAYLLDGCGGVIAQTQAPHGIGKSEQHELVHHLEQATEEWDRTLPVMVCGMAGSRNGLWEVPYAECPCDCAGLQAGVEIRVVGGRKVGIVPGIRCQNHGMMDVMRGEETQLLGLMASGQASSLMVMPGTHSKWVSATAGAIESFASYMTGETFELFSSDSIVSKLMDGPGKDVQTDASARQSFLRGVDLGLADRPRGLTHKVFSSRTQVLAGKLSADCVAPYLSGVLIGDEIQSGLADFHVPQGDKVVLVGADTLCARYTLAFERAGVETVSVGNTVVSGLFQIGAGIESWEVTADALEISPAAECRLASALAECPLVAILRGIRPNQIEPAAEALGGSGFRIIEVPLNSPDPYESIRLLAECTKGLKNTLIGAGTVLSVQEVDKVAESGGELIVSPNTDLAVIRRAVERGLVCIPGVCTPSEAFAALGAGATALKLFPAEAVPPSILKAMRAVLPKRTVVLAVGGINGAEDMVEYIEAGANGFGIGSAVFKPSMSLSEMAANATRLVEAGRSVGGWEGP